MDALYRGLLQVSVGLGLLTFVIGIVLVVVQPNAPFLFLLPRGWANGAQIFFLAAVALYCLIRVKERR